MKGQHGVMFLKLQIKSFLKAYIVQKSLLLWRECRWSHLQVTLNLPRKQVQERLQKLRAGILAGICESDRRQINPFVQWVCNCLAPALRITWSIRPHFGNFSQVWISTAMACDSDSVVAQP
jgi:hypothetical protein